MTREELLIARLRRKLRVTKRYKAEVEECLASAREQILELRKQLAEMGARKFHRTKNGRVWS